MLKQLVPKEIEKNTFDMVNFELLITTFIPMMVSSLISIIIFMCNTFQKKLLPKSLQPS